MRRFHFDELDSTNDEARRLAPQYPGEALFIDAAIQTAGRGRDGRVWQSPRGGAWLSVVWPQANQLPSGATGGQASGAALNESDPPLAPLAAAVAMRRALADLAPELGGRLRIKWPNDLLVGDEKIAGILCEQTLAGASRIVIIGVGVNVEFEASDLAAPLRRPATSLYTATGRHITVDQALNAAESRLTETLHAMDDGNRASILADFAAHLAFVGEVHSFQVGSACRSGAIRGIDSAGRLILEGDGERWLLSAGEMVEGR